MDVLEDAFKGSQNRMFGPYAHVFPREDRY